MLAERPGLSRNPLREVVRALTANAAGGAPSRRSRWRPGDTYRTASSSSSCSRRAPSTSSSSTRRGSAASTRTSPFCCSWPSSACRSGHTPAGWACVPSAKLSIMVTEADWSHWTVAGLRPNADTVLEAFGPRRPMFGSDRPVSTLAADCGAVVSVARELTKGLRAPDRDDVFRQTAARVCRLRPCPAPELRRRAWRSAYVPAVHFPRGRPTTRGVFRRTRTVPSLSPAQDSSDVLLSAWSEDPRIGRSSRRLVCLREATAFDRIVYGWACQRKRPRAAPAPRGGAWPLLRAPG